MQKDLLTIMLISDCIMYRSLNSYFICCAVLTGYSRYLRIILAHTPGIQLSLSLPLYDCIIFTPAYRLYKLSRILVYLSPSIYFLLCSLTQICKSLGQAIKVHRSNTASVLGFIGVIPLRSSGSSEQYGFGPRVYRGNTASVLGFIGIIPLRSSGSSE